MLGGAGCASADPSGSDRDLRVEEELGQGPDLFGADLTNADAGSLADLASPPSCNPANKVLSAAAGPDVCVYGERCDDVSTKCGAVLPASCGMATGAPAWNKAAMLAPVITKASAQLLTSTSAATECAGGDPAALVTIELYAPSYFTTSNNAAAFLQQVKWRKSTTSTDPFLSATFIRAQPSPNQKFVTFMVGINCGGAAGASKQAGMYVVDEAAHVSNTVCVSW